MKKSLYFTIVTMLISTLFLSTFVSVKSASALSGSDWQAGRIIDDSLFTNKSSMSVADVQTFLNTMVGTGGYSSIPGQCDTFGARNAAPYNSGITRAAYAASIGKPTRWTCLNNYYEVPKITPGPNLPASNYGSDTIPAGAISAAQIIWNAAQTYNISPKVLLVTIQKESSGPLTTDDWPWQNQYTYAMGADCPDSTGCDPNYAGFSIQVSESAALFRYYLDNMNQPWWTHYRPGNNTVLYNPNSSCGSSSVNILTYATAALYTYTPYQPNQAALNDIYGVGDHVPGGANCSAFGNRNFWRIYSNWFGPTTSSLGGITMNNIQQPNATPARGETVTYIYSLTNNLATSVTLNAVGVVGRLGTFTGANRDFGWQGPITLLPGIPQQFTFTSLIRDQGPLYVWPAVNYLGSYTHYNNWGELLNAHDPNLGLITPLASTILSPIAGQTATISATIKNNESQPIDLSMIGIPVRYYGTYGYDTAWISPVGPLQPGATQAISGNITFDKPGPYTAWLSGIIANQYTTLSPSINFTVTKAVPNFSLTYVETPNLTPAIGEDVTIRFKLKNNSGVPLTLDAVGIVGRYDSPYTGKNSDFGWAGPTSTPTSTAFSVGEEKQYDLFVRNISETKTLFAWVAVNYKGIYAHYNNWGFQLTPHVPNLSISVPLSINAGVKPTIGQSVPVTSTIKNNEPKPIRYNAIGIPARYYGAYSYDTAWRGAGTLTASGQAGDSVALSGNILFDKSGPYTIWNSININGQYITIGNQSGLNL